MCLRETPVPWAGWEPPEKKKMKRVPGLHLFIQRAWSSPPNLTHFLGPSNHPSLHATPSGSEIFFSVACPSRCKQNLVFCISPDGLLRNHTYYLLATQIAMSQRGLSWGPTRENLKTAERFLVLLLIIFPPVDENDLLKFPPCLCYNQKGKFYPHTLETGFVCN